MQLDIHFGLGPRFKIHVLLILPCDLSINVTLNVSLINVSFAAAFLKQIFRTDNFSGYQLANIC